MPSHFQQKLHQQCQEQHGHLILISLMCIAGNNTIMMHLMREAIRNHQHASQGSFSQMLQSVAKHPGLQAALHQQVTDSLTSWHDGLNKLFVCCPFLTKLDLSKCAAVVSAEDYATLTLQSSSDDDIISGQGGSSSGGSSASNGLHPCASLVINQQALPISIKHLLPILRRLPCLAALHLHLTKVMPLGSSTCKTLPLCVHVHVLDWWQAPPDHTLLLDVHICLWQCGQSVELFA